MLDVSLPSVFSSQRCFYSSLAPRQDVPPPDGYLRIAYQRHLPLRGPKGWVLLMGTSLVILGGLWRAREGNRIQWELKREKSQSRVHLYPFLQAEKDRFYLRMKNQHDKLVKASMQSHEIVSENTQTQEILSLNQPVFYQHEKIFHPELLFLLDDPKSHPIYPGITKVSDLM